MRRQRIKGLHSGTLGRWVRWILADLLGKVIFFAATVLRSLDAVSELREAREHERRTEVNVIFIKSAGIFESSPVCM